jgi:riboflavin kinase/FMN adenylyltransferase
MKLLNSFEEKAELLENLGVDHLVKINFTEEFSKMSSAQFIKKIIAEKIGTKVLVIGYDHRFGRNREGSFEYLKKHSGEYGFEVEEIPEQDVEHVAVSSTKIRQALEEGDVRLAAEFLSRPYFVTGTVVKGDQLGRQLGYPTANIACTFENKLVPRDGIYAVRVVLNNESMDGVLSVGFRPTFRGKDRRIEAHIFDFQGDIYGSRLKIEFIERIRDELKFENTRELIEEMKQDERKARKILSI